MEDIWMKEAHLQGPEFLSTIYLDSTWRLAIDLIEKFNTYGQ